MSHTADLQVYRQRRRYERYDCTLDIRYGVEATDCCAEADTISEGGMHILTNDPFEVGTRIDLTVEFPDGEVKLKGEVVWAIQVPEALREALVYGMGVELIDPGYDWAESLAEWTEQQEAE